MFFTYIFTKKFVNKLYTRI